MIITTAKKDTASDSVFIEPASPVLPLHTTLNETLTSTVHCTVLGKNYSKIPYSLVSKVNNCLKNGLKQME